MPNAYNLESNCNLKTKLIHISDVDIRIIFTKLQKDSKLYVVKVQRSSAYIVTSDSAQTDYPHVTHHLKTQLIVYKMVLVLWSAYERGQSYGCFTTVGVKKIA